MDILLPVILGISVIFLFPFLMTRGIKSLAKQPVPGGEGLVASGRKRMHGTAAYLLGLLSGIAAAIALQTVFASVFGIFSESRAPSMFMSVGIIFALPQLALLSLIPARIIHSLLQIIQVPISCQSVLTGMLLGAIGPIEYLLNGGSESLSSRFMGHTEIQVAAMSFILPVAGAMGGFVYWRAMGYPGISAEMARVIDKNEGVFQTIRTVLFGGIFDRARLASPVLSRVAMSPNQTSAARRSHPSDEALAEADAAPARTRAVRAAPTRKSFGRAPRSR